MVFSTQRSPPTPADGRLPTGGQIPWTGVAAADGQLFEPALQSYEIEIEKMEQDLQKQERTLKRQERTLGTTEICRLQIC